MRPKTDTFLFRQIHLGQKCIGQVFLHLPKHLVSVKAPCIGERALFQSRQRNGEPEVTSFSSLFLKQNLATLLPFITICLVEKVSCQKTNSTNCSLWLSGYLAEKRLNFVVDSYSPISYRFNLMQPIQSYYGRNKTILAEYRLWQSIGHFNSAETGKNLVSVVR